jgi:hypothetical protein
MQKPQIATSVCMHVGVAAGYCLDSELSRQCGILSASVGKAYSDVLSSKQCKNTNKRNKPSVFTYIQISYVNQLVERPLFRVTVALTWASPHLFPDLAQPRVRCNTLNFPFRGIYPYLIRMGPLANRFMGYAYNAAYAAALMRGASYGWRAF